MNQVLKLLVYTSIAGTSLISNANAVTMFTGANFSMLNVQGEIFGGTNDVTWAFDETVVNTDAAGTAFNGDIASDWPFFGFTWDAHEVRVFAQGSYTFDTTCTAGQIQAGISVCNNPLQPGQTEQYLTIEVGPGQLGLHMLLDWQAHSDMDIALVWDQYAVWDDPDGSASPVNNLWLGPGGIPPDTLLPWQLVSTDADGDGFNGVAFVDGPFMGYSPNFNFGQVPVPAAVWLFGSGLIGLIGLARRKA